MREIKFRAWDKEKKIMRYGVDVKHGRACFATPNSFLIWYSKPEEEVVMQFTGLKDKRGKEIYEGDLIHFQTSFENYNDEYDYSKDLTVVEWVDKCAGFWPFDLNARWRCEVMDLEVIGNIYENPELLKASIQ